MQNTASDKSIRVTLTFVSPLGFPALDYQARRIAKELEIELSETISEEQGKYDCALSADQIDSLADNGGLLTGAAGFVRL